MFNHVTPIVQEYHHNAIQQYQDLQKEYKTLKNKVKNSYDKGLSDKKYKDKLENKVDNIAIDDQYDELFKRYEINKDDAIKRLFDRSYQFDEDKVVKLLKIRKKIIRKRISNIDLDKIGTSMNTLRDFYHDVYMDVERNKHNLIKDENNNKYNIVYNNLMSLEVKDDDFPIEIGLD